MVACCCYGLCLERWFCMWLFRRESCLVCEGFRRRDGGIFRAACCGVRFWCLCGGYGKGQGMAVALFKDREGTELRQQTLCAHCGASTDVEGRVGCNQNVFCCSGCQFVYQLIHEQGLRRFYDLRDGPQAPVTSGVFRSRNFEWGDDLSQKSSGRFSI